MPTAMTAYMGTMHIEEPCATSTEPRTQIKKLSRTFSQDTTTSSSTWYGGTGNLFKDTKHEEDPPAYYESKLCTVGFILKIVEWSLCILCTGLYFEGSGLIFEFKKQLFPYVVYWTYMMITGVIILSYLLGQKMREMLIRIYNVIGAIMFLIAAVIIFNLTIENWDKWNHTHLDSTIEDNKEMHQQNAVNRPKLAKMLMTQSILCFINSFVYFTDIVYSLYVSYKSVTINIQVKST